MKIILFSISLALIPYVVMASVFCEECIYDIDWSDKGSIFSCIATIAVGLIVRAIEKKRLKKALKRQERDDNAKY